MCFFFFLSHSLSLFHLLASVKIHTQKNKLLKLSLFLTMESNLLYCLSSLVVVLLLSVTSTVTSKDEVVSCTMCSSCDNPCNPAQSYPPPPPPSRPPPSPSTTTACPPPPSPPSSGGGGGSYYYPPPSQSGGGKYPPPYGDGGQGYYYPPPYSGNYPTPPPPNPIVPYFPFYYHTPPPGSGSDRFMGSSSIIFALFAVFLCLV
uniref:Uncharacterized protein n=1 Tax=Noccaea caerulescens TaxID=107243 RepID=A0A1J3JZC7_NOCCA